VAGKGVARTLPCGLSGTAQIALPLGGTRGYVVANTEEGNLGVFDFALDGGSLPSSYTKQSALGLLSGATLIRARHHASGHLLSLTNAGVEVVDLAKRAQLQRPADSTLFVRRGERPGQQSGSVSVAPLPGRNAYALLEQGARRVQALDFDGNPLGVWAGRSSILLTLDAGVVFTDLDVDSAGNVWVLSYKPNGAARAVFNLEVYNSAGAFVVRFVGINAMALAVDNFSTVFTQNAENLGGPGGYPEPTLSVWAPENPS